MVLSIEHMSNYTLYCKKVPKAALECLQVFIWLKRCSSITDSLNLYCKLSQPVLFVLYQQDPENMC